MLQFCLSLGKRAPQQLAALQRIPACPQGTFGIQQRGHLLKRVARSAQTRLAHTSAVSQGTAADSAKAASDKPAWTIEMLYDGDCPLCMREVNSLRKAEKASSINFVNIAAEDYSPSEHAGISYEQAMGKIHAVRRDGGVVTNVEAFKQLYEAAGRGWVYSFADVPPLRWAADWVYDVWAKYRMAITGRPDLDTVVEQKKTCR